ncbi:hypothetical protein CU103_20625 [Phyllobacterium sophorae]|uniref:Uncharacterized protein n=1 Tax=Phyllobacterium sophorae TaxID=1520277 RepID=A0A2P7B6Z3_9HYPH|nr:hypothetical protein CU103_20625 [Phyllobacterium sophorae]
MQVRAAFGNIQTFVTPPRLQLQRFRLIGRDGINRDLVRCANDVLFLSNSEKQALLRDIIRAFRTICSLLSLRLGCVYDNRPVTHALRV